MKLYTLKKSFHGYKKGTPFYLIARIRIYWSERVRIENEGFREQNID